MATSKWLCCSVIISIYFSVGIFAENVIPQTDLLARIATIEKQGQDLKATVERQSEIIKRQDEAIRILLEWKNDQTMSDNKDLPNDVIKQVMNTTNNGSKATTHIAAGKQRRKLEIQASVNKPSRIGRAVEGTVAFHAVITRGEVPHLGPNQKIVFDVVHLNNGGGYHNQHGLFIAPVPGIYVFSTSVLSHSVHGDRISVGIMKNGQILSAVLAQGDSARVYDQGSVSVVTQLAAADEIWVAHRYGSDDPLWGDSYTSFMGYLAIPL